MKYKEVVINKQFGGFSLSHEGVMEYAKNKGIKLYPYVDKRNIDGSLKSFRDEDRIEPYTDQEACIIYYYTKPQKGKDRDDAFFSDRDIDRDDPALIKTVRKLKKDANGQCATLKIVKIPDDTEFEIDEYDGLESIHEKHRSWG